MRLITLLIFLVLTQSGIVAQWQNTGEQFSCVFVNDHLYDCVDSDTVFIPKGGIDTVFVPPQRIYVQKFFADGTFELSETVYPVWKIILPIVFVRGQ